MSQNGTLQSLSDMQNELIRQVSNENSRTVQYVFCIDLISIRYDENVT